MKRKKKAKKMSAKFRAQAKIMAERLGWASWKGVYHEMKKKYEQEKK